MVEDILEPVGLFKKEFKQAHARHTAEFFEELLRNSGIDERANAETVAKLRQTEAQLGQKNSGNSLLRFVRAVLVVGAVVCLIVAYHYNNWIWLVGTVLAPVLVLAKLNPAIKGLGAEIDELTKVKDGQLKEAWLQMEPLNRLYDWDFAAKLMRKTVPRIELDFYFTNARLDELRREFGWSDVYNESRSILFSHSGVLNGNPFVVARSLRHWMGQKTYHGHLEISWTERVRDSNGNWRTETRRETLRASVTKPFPEYGDDAAVIYGNEAAPDLNFSRTPSSLSTAGDGFFDRWRMSRAIKKLESKARSSSEGNNFTVMANREFDALFGATDRDHEVQFRLLYTALAQQETTALLKDAEVGYGDDFSFIKRGMINIVQPAHLAKTDISADPTLFRRYELAAARANFNAYHNDFFRSFYFGLAPLLAIPLYQQHRPHCDIYRDVYGRKSCFWEHEAIANYFGEDKFAHPACVTRSILKTATAIDSDGVQTVTVDASGYSGIDRVDFVSVLGGDGNFHRVPVPWTEYIPVSNSSRIVVAEDLSAVQAATGGSSPAGDCLSGLRSRGVDPVRAVRRRFVVAALLS